MEEAVLKEDIAQEIFKMMPHLLNLPQKKCGLTMMRRQMFSI